MKPWWTVADTFMEAVGHGVEPHSVAVDAMAGSEGMEEATVYLVEDDPAVRRSLAELLRCSRMRVEAFENGRSFLRGHDPSLPGCLVLDLRLPDLSALDILEAMAGLSPPPTALIISGHGDVGTAVEAMKRGVLDFIEKPFRPQAMIDQIRRAIQQDRRVRAREAIRRAIRESMRLLSERESQVLTLLVRGSGNKQIASELDISEKTVAVHRSHVLSKMRAQSLAELVRMVDFVQTAA